MHSGSTTAHFTNTIDCGDGDIRLVAVSNPLEGRVEVCYDGVWGTVCSNGWDVPDAVVACRQLGYHRSGKHHYIPRNTKFIVIFLAGATVRFVSTVGPGTGPILLENVGCTGTESRLFDCPNSGLEVNTCTHADNDVGVTCIPGMYK